MNTQDIKRTIFDKIDKQRVVIYRDSATGKVALDNGVITNIENLWERLDFKRLAEQVLIRHHYISAETDLKTEALAVLLEENIVGHDFLLVLNLHKFIIDLPMAARISSLENIGRDSKYVVQNRWWNSELKIYQKVEWM